MDEQPNFLHKRGLEHEAHYRREELVLGNYSANQKVKLVKRASLDLFFFAVLGRNCGLCVCINSVSVTSIIKNIFSYKTVS